MLLLEMLEKKYQISELPQMQCDSYGKPYFLERKDIFFNYSHCHAGIMCGVGEGKIGVDVESMRPLRKGLAKRVCSMREQELLECAEYPQKEFMKMWVCKEAYVKYTGEGLTRDLRKIETVAVLNGADRLYDAYVQLWEDDTFFFCACAEKKNDLYLVK